MKERRRRHDDAHRPMGGKGKRALPPRAKAKTDDDESFANRAIDAELDHAMGVDNPDYDWLVEPYK